MPLDADLVHDLDGDGAAVTERTRVVFVCNPNNPTGTSVGAEAFDRFAASLPTTSCSLIDEAYVDFARRPDFPDALAWVARRPGTVVDAHLLEDQRASPGCASATASPIASSRATCSARATRST